MLEPTMLSMGIFILQSVILLILGFFWKSGFYLLKDHLQDGKNPLITEDKLKIMLNKHVSKNDLLIENERIKTYFDDKDTHLMNIFKNMLKEVQLDMLKQLKAATATTTQISSEDEDKSEDKDGSATDSKILIKYNTNGASGSFTDTFSDNSTNYSASTGFASAGDWTTAILKPSSSINNVYSIQFQLSYIGGTATFPAPNFKINDISIVYRAKRIK